MTDSLSKIPSGFRYCSAAESRARRAVETTALAVFAGWSYEEIVTPAFDYYSLFQQGLGEKEAERSFRLSDSDGSLLALRPDVTSSIARAAATLFARRPRPLRLCYSQSVFYRQGQSNADWRRESNQIGCELLGRNSIAANMEVLAIANEVLDRLELNRRYVITLSDVEIFGGIAEELQLDAVQRDALRHLVDIRAVAQVERVLTDYTSPQEASEFANLIQLSGKGEIFGRARRVISNARSCAALDRLESLWQVIESLGWSDKFEIDLGDVSRLDYYTGLTFKIYIEGVGSRVGGGGRYDHLTARFGRTEPAIGFVLELDALADLTARQSNLPSRPADVLLPANTDDVSAVFQRAIAARAANKSVLID